MWPKLCTQSLLPFIRFHFCPTCILSWLPSVIREKGGGGSRAEDADSALRSLAESDPELNHPSSGSRAVPAAPSISCLLKSPWNVGLSPLGVRVTFPSPVSVFLPQARSEMDKYLSSEVPPVPLLPDKKYRRESASVVDEFFSTEKPSSTPYSVNINVILPDTTHLRTGLYRPPKPMAPFPQIKTEPGFSQPCSSSSGPTQTLPDFTSVFSMPQSVAVNNIFIKQEMPAEIPLAAHPQQPQLFPLPLGAASADIPTLASSSSSTTAISCLSGVTMSTGSVGSVAHRAVQPAAPLKQYPHVVQGQGSFGNIPGQFYPAPGVTLPPSPPNSQPGSPENQPELINTISPPPSYEATFGLKLVQSSQMPPGPNGVGGLSQGHIVMQPPKYNRRNNPELEKRRIHHCDYPGVLIIGGPLAPRG